MHGNLPTRLMLSQKALWLYSGLTTAAACQSNPALWHNGQFEKTSGYCTDLFFAQAMKWMEAKRAAKQPFFAYLPLNAARWWR